MLVVRWCNSNIIVILKDKPNEKSIGPKLTSLLTQKMATSQNAKVSITKIPTPPTFLMNLAETFGINVNMDFANNIEA